MQGGFIAQAIAGNRLPGRDTILFLDPTFPVSMRQTRFLGLKLDSVELSDFRGPALVREVERRFAAGTIGGLLYSSPNNPSWVTLKEDELRGLGELCTRYDVLAIEDLAYLGMDFREDYSQPGRPPYPADDRPLHRPLLRAHLLVEDLQLRRGAHRASPRSRPPS